MHGGTAGQRDGIKIRPGGKNALQMAKQRIRAPGDAEGCNLDGLQVGCWIMGESRGVAAVWASLGPGNDGKLYRRVGKFRVAALAHDGPSIGEMAAVGAQDSGIAMQSGPASAFSGRVKGQVVED